MLKEEIEKREKMANDAKSELVKLMSCLPDVADNAIPDATSNETAINPFNLDYFGRSTLAPNPNGSPPSNLETIFYDILKSQYPLSGLLKLSTLVNLGLSIHYSRHIAINVSKWVDQSPWNISNDIKSIIKATQQYEKNRNKNKNKNQKQSSQSLETIAEEEKDDEKNDKSLITLLDTKKSVTFTDFKLYVYRKKPRQEKREEDY